jgi:hypothetical protein
VDDPDGRADTTRICRVQGVRLRWKDRLVEFDVLDEHDLAAGYRDFILDDEALWRLAGTAKEPTQPRRDGLILTFAAGSTVVNTSFDPTKLKPRQLNVDDILDAWGAVSAGNRGPFRITAVTASSIGIDTPAAANETLGSLLWELRMSHETRPTFVERPTAYLDPDHPGDFPIPLLPSSVYGALADDDVTGPAGKPGAFSSSDDGYQL